MHSASGFGSTKASVSTLAGDSLLRSLTQRMSTAVGTVVGTGAYQTLGSLGIKLDMSGHMSLDSTKLSAALQADPNAVATVIAGATDGNGAAGMIAARQTSLTTRSRNLTDRIAREQDRLDQYADSLRKQFTALDSISSANATNSAYLTNYFK